MTLVFSKMRTTFLKFPNLPLHLPSPPRERLCTLLLVLQSSLLPVCLHSARMSLLLGVSGDRIRKCVLRKDHELMLTPNSYPVSWGWLVFLPGSRGDCCAVLSRVQLFCIPVGCSLPGFSVHGISQARILEWVAISYSRSSLQRRDRTWVYCFSRRILYHWTIKGASVVDYIGLFRVSVYIQF